MKNRVPTFDDFRLNESQGSIEDIISYFDKQWKALGVYPFYAMTRKLNLNHQPGNNGGTRTEIKSLEKTVNKKYPELHTSIVNGEVEDNQNPNLYTLNIELQGESGPGNKTGWNVNLGFHYSMKSIEDSVKSLLNIKRI